MKIETKELSKEESLKLSSYLNNAYKDYKAARILFLNNQLLQACVLANTSIEKYLKTFLLFQGQSIKNNHDTLQFLDQLKNLENGSINEVNQEFIKVLCKAYKTRYFHNDNPNYIPINFNLTIFKNKSLAELDLIISNFAKKINIGWEKGAYLEDVDRNEIFIVTENYLLNGLNKEEFLAKKPEFVYELRKMLNGEIVEIDYHTNEAKGDIQFDLPGFQILEDGQFKTNFIPIGQE